MARRKTPVAARELGISYHQLIGLIRYDKIAPPDRDSSGDYLWSDADLERVRSTLATMRRSKPQEPCHAD
jgi:hypothetical protein